MFEAALCRKATLAWACGCKPGYQRKDIAALQLNHSQKDPIRPGLFTCQFC